MTVIEIDADSIIDEESFHEVFSEKLLFPGYYGRNMNAWIDCMRNLDNDQDGPETQIVEEGGVVTLIITNAGGLKKRNPAVWVSLNECAAFVNWSTVAHGGKPIIALAYYA